MKNTITMLLALATLFVIMASTTFAEEPTWMFTVPKAQSLKQGYYNIGFLYFDFGIADNLELGIHGIKYSIPPSGNIAIGVSIIPYISTYGAYLVFSPDIGSGNLSIGVKTSPYAFFAGIEAPISSSLKLVAELNNGLTAGVRILPTKNWTLDIFFGLVNIEVYKYKFTKIVVEEYDPYPGILFAYSGRF